jgi:hypothetical protein
MSVIVFRLNDVPEDEAQAVRDLLTENEIEFFETSAGKWGFSIAAIWIKDDSLKDKARQLIEEYQDKHFQDVHARHEELRRRGELDSFASRFVNNPLQVIVYILLVLLVIYLSLTPFIEF